MSAGASAREACVIIDYGSGNLRSAEKSFERAAGRIGGLDIRVTSEPEAVATADRIVLPGVGAFGDCAAGVAAVPGLREALESRVLGDGRPFIGICVGMQLMATRGLERGRFDGFDWIPGEVVEIAPEDRSLKIPHMGWNALEDFADHPVLEDLAGGGERAYAYFVHSYAILPEDPSHRLAVARYGGEIAAIVGRDNMVGTQFHPEKSQRVGLRLIENFLRWRP